MRRPEQAQSELLEPPSVAERRLRARLGELVAAQAVEDEAGRAGLRGGVAGPGLYHRYNAVLKRVSGDKSRAQMTLSELEAAIGWLERNRPSEHLHLLDGDPRYAWLARQRGEWRPPVGRVGAARHHQGSEMALQTANSHPVLVSSTATAPARPAQDRTIDAGVARPEA